MSENMETRLYLDASDFALAASHPPAGLVHHSRRGVQYASTEYRLRLTEHGIVCSMSHKTDRWDHAIAGSFWGTLKIELVSRTAFKTRAEALRAIFEFIEVFYNRVRLHSLPGYQSPAIFESLTSSTLLAALPSVRENGSP